MGISNEELIKRIRQGEEELKADLLENNKGLIYQIMGDFSYLLKNEANKEDLFQAGCLGLMKALKGYDFKYNTKFSTYAYRYIKGEVLRLADAIMNQEKLLGDMVPSDNSDLVQEEVADYVRRCLNGECNAPNLETEVTNREMVRRILDKVTPRQRTILIYRYKKDLTQTEIASILGIHQVEVSREEKRARNHIRLLFGESWWGVN